MIIAIDTETYVEEKGTWKPTLDARKFSLSCIIREDKPDKPIFFTDKAKMQVWLDEFRKMMGRQGKSVQAYAHNHEFDWYAYGKLKDKRIDYYCYHPFIAKWNGGMVKGGDIDLYDTKGLFRGTLAEMGEALGLEKKEMPETDVKSMFEVMPYCQRDTEIVLKAVLRVKELCQEHGIKARRFITIGQIAINNFLTKAEAMPYRDEMFKPKEKTWTLPELYHPTDRAKKLIQEAYRGGRIEAFKVGIFEPCRHIDRNNMYTWAAINMPMPNLSTEMTIKDPLSKVTKKYLLDKEGVSRCTVRCPVSDIGLLGIRYGPEDEVYYPHNGQYLTGSWTHIELREALKEGYTILDIHESVLYDRTANNPFPAITQELFDKRMTYPKDSFERWFFKGLQNHMYGKFGQDRTMKTYCWDDVDLQNSKAMEGYTVANRFGLENLYMKEQPGKVKRFYAPIIPTYINAYGRVAMYRDLKQIPVSKRLYCDTDSIVCIEGKRKDKTDKFLYGKDIIGAYKVESEGATVQIYRKKVYMINDSIRMSGAPQRWLNPEDFRKGTAKYRRMVGMKKAKHEDKIGSFEEVETDLIRKSEEFLEEQRYLNDEKIVIDHKTLDNIDMDKVLGIVEGSA